MRTARGAVLRALVLLVFAVACQSGATSTRGEATTHEQSPMPAASSPKATASTAPDKCEYDVGPGGLIAYEPERGLSRALVKRVSPSYPAEAVRARIQGEVTVRIIVNGKGEVVDACAKDGHALFREPAVDAARRWEFKKNFGNPDPVPAGAHMLEFIYFKFVLDGAQSSEQVGPQTVTVFPAKRKKQ